MHARRARFCHRISKRFTVASSILSMSLALLVPFSSYAFVRLANGTTGLRWSQMPVLFTISTAKASPQITDGSSDPAIRLGFKQWQAIPSANVQFQEDTNPQDRARTDWTSPDLHLVWFDNDGSSNMFTPGSGLVAVTPVTFDGNGLILDADMIFNNRDHQFSTTGLAGTFDVQNIATHEAGHFIGLDHSAIVGATMNPFAIQQDTRLRSLEKDDVAGASTIYQNGNFAFGWISGKVVDSSNAAVSGAHVVAEALDGSGTPVSSTLSNNDGTFDIQGLPAGNYTVYVEPLDGPVQGSNLSLATSKLAINTNFGTTFVGGAGNPTRIQVATATGTPLGTIAVRPSVGLTITNAGPLAALAGDTVTISGQGTGFMAGDMITVTGDGVTLKAPPEIDPSGNNFSITIKLDPAMPTGLHTIRLVRSTGDARCYTGGFEVRGSAPTLSGIHPTTGSVGTSIALSGTNLQGNGVVILGPGMVVNPQSSGSSVVFACPNIPDGTYDVTYQNPDGQFAAITRAFTVSGSTAGTSGTSGTGSSGTGTTAGSPAPTPVTSTAPDSPTQTTTTTTGFVQRGSSGGGGGGSGCTVARQGEGNPAAVLPIAVLAGLIVVVRRRRAA